MQEHEVVVEMRDVGRDHLPEPDPSLLIVRAGTLEGLVGELAQDAGELAAADLEQRERVLQRLLVAEEPIDVGRLVRVEERQGLPP